MKRAFTVPEMLAVIAIIVIVMSLLLPAIQTARVPAYQALCANNNRQIIQASLTYATQNQGWMPFTNWLSQEDGSNEWIWGGWLYKYPGGWAAGGHKTGQLWSFLG